MPPIRDWQIVVAPHEPALRNADFSRHPHGGREPLPTEVGVPVHVEGTAKERGRLAREILHQHETRGRAARAPVKVVVTFPN